MELIRFTSADSEGNSELMNDGLHLPGLDALDSQTLCGAFMTGAKYVEVEGDAPTCKNCIGAARQLLNRYTRKQANKW